MITRATDEWRVGAVLLLLACATAAGALGLVSPTELLADGQTRELNSALRNIKWSDSKDLVLEKLKKQRLEEMRKREDLQHDRVAMQRARKRLLEQFDKIRESYTKLEEEGETGYEVSVVADEYTKGNNEALLRLKDEVAQRFFFFIDGKLYKMVVAYKQSYLKNIGFEAFVGRVSRKYGRPEATEYDTIAGEETLAYARWKDEETILEVKNEKEFFGTYVMVFSDRQRVKTLEKSDRSFGGSDKKQEGISKQVKELSADSDSANSNEGVVNGMIGQSVEVDLSGDDETSSDKEGSSSEKATDETTKQAKADDSKSEESDDEQASSKETTDDEDQEDRDFSDISPEADEQEDDDDELIVY